MQIFKFLERKPYAFLWPVILALFILTAYLSTILPGAPCNGYVSEIIAFEFAENAEDINTVLASIDDVEIDGRQFQVHNMDWLNKVDWLFMIVYSGLLGGFCWLTMSIGGPKWLWLGVVLAIGALVTDFLENQALFSITEIYQSSSQVKDYQLQLRRLFVFTWLKWTSIGVALAFIGTYLVSTRQRLSMLCGVLLFLPVLSMAYHVLLPSPAAINVMVLSVSLGFLLITVFALLFKFNQTTHQ